MSDLLPRYKRFVEDALEASIYVAPLAHGLTLAELREVGEATAHKRGAIDDAITALRQSARFGAEGERVVFVPEDGQHFANFLRGRFKGDPREPQALDFPLEYLEALEEERGKKAALDSAANIIAEGERKGLGRHALHIAITVLRLAEWLEEKDGTLRIHQSKSSHARPGEQLEQFGRDWDRQGFDRILEAVREVILKRATEPARAAAAAPPGTLAPTAAKLAEIFDSRNLHPRVITDCRTLFVGGHNREAVVGACQLALGDVRQRTGRTEDGDDLVSLAFGPKVLLLCVNDGATDNDRMEQNGVMLLFKGLVAAFRNPLVHGAPAPSVERTLDALSLASLLMRYLDASHV